MFSNTNKHHHYAENYILQAWFLDVIFCSFSWHSWRPNNKRAIQSTSIWLGPYIMWVRQSLRDILPSCMISLQQFPRPHLDAWFVWLAPVLHFPFSFTDRLVIKPRSLWKDQAIIQKENMLSAQPSENSSMWSHVCRLHVNSCVVTWQQK